ncbi:MAG: hypothetical protein J6S85_19460 [Methanobrevibacter sp.]|nr:hypothetical protein [Methanobrevibacter sp.]
MAIDLSKFKAPKLLEANVLIEVRNHIIYAWSKNHEEWVELDQNKWLVPSEYGAKDHEYFMWESPSTTAEQRAEGFIFDPTASRFTDEQWEELPAFMRDIFIATGFRRQKHIHYAIDGYAYTKRGLPFRNFHYENGKLYADVYNY